MNLSRPFPFASAEARRRRGGGFTLIEMLVAISILVIIVLLFAQMLAMVSQAWRYGHGRVNNFTKARAMLELLTRDIQSGVYRNDLSAFPSSTGTFEFYTARFGIPTSTPSTGLRTVSVVQYFFSVPQNINGAISNSLVRADSSIAWGDETTSPAFQNLTGFPSTPTSRNTAPGVIAFDLVFISAGGNPSGTFSSTFTPVSSSGTLNPYPTRAVSITLAVLDDATLQHLNSTQLSTLNTGLVGAVPNPPLKSVKAYWDSYLNNTVNWSSYPKNTDAGLATFERYVPLPNAP